MSDPARRQGGERARACEGQHGGFGVRSRATKPRTRQHPARDVAFSQYVERAMASAVYEPDPAGGWVVSVPALPGCASQGETVEEARAMIRNAIEGWVTLALQLGDPILDIHGQGPHALC
jgi:predicted RNase H-like HicB family nuclease